MPFLKKMTVEPNRFPNQDYPFSVLAIKEGASVEFTAMITFLVGENGTGKSTILEGIAKQCGFNLSGGSRNHFYSDEQEQPTLSPALRLAWLPKVTEGFFMRAESFTRMADYIDRQEADHPGILDYYGGKSLHHQSHGESFFALFGNRFSFKGKKLYILDEPEAALSPRRQYEFLSLLRKLERKGDSQFLIATHSPILLAYPGAVIHTMKPGLPKIAYHETDHYRFTRDFLNDPEIYLRKLE